MLSFTIGKTSITLFIDGEFATIDDSHANYEPLLRELKKAPDERDLVAIKSFATIKAMIAAKTFGRVSITDCSVLFEGTEIGNYLAGRMLEIFNDGIDIEPYAKFMENVMANPATYTHGELYQWMEKAKLPITPDGHFLAFKKVRNNYHDCATGKFDNSVGNILEMSREACDVDRHNHCSSGFHFCSPGYLGSFHGQRVLVVKINPRDVTAIPSDYKFTKGRCCRYEVVAELTAQSKAWDPAWTQPVIDMEDPAELPGVIIQPEPYDASDLDAFGSLNPTLDDTTTQTVIKLAPKAPANVQAKTFVTGDGRSFTKKQVKKAITDNTSTRGAARSLGIGESTLRGWIKKL